MSFTTRKIKPLPTKRNAAVLSSTSTNSYALGGKGCDNRYDPNDPLSVALVKRARIKDASNDDNNNDDDDYGDNHDDYDYDSARKRKTLSLILPPPLPSTSGTSGSELQKLPGGYVIRSHVTNAPISVVEHVRNYLDIVFGTIVLASNMHKSICNIVPYVVSNILRYNNIVFKTIKMYQSTIEIFEPLWYSYKIDCSELSIFYYERSIDQFCEQMLSVPIIFTSGTMNIEKFNPYKSMYNEPIDTAMYKCAILSDHLAQHIITDIMRTLNNDHVPDVEGIHYGFTKYGTTLHSMFDICEYKSKCANTNSTHIFDFIQSPSPRFR